MTDRRVRLAALVLVGVVWLGACASFLGYIAVEAVAGDLSCPVPYSDSEYYDDSEHYESHWALIPPGVVCETPDGDAGASWWRVVIVGVLLAAPLTAMRLRPPRAERPRN